jgi:hypothetical protein
MTQILVTVDWRTASPDGWPGGQLYLADLESHKILDHHTGKLEPNDLQDPGGWSGFRGAAWDGQTLYVADMWCIRRFSILQGTTDFQLSYLDGWYTGPHFDVHGICLEAGKEGIWVTTTASDAVARLTFDYWPFCTTAEHWNAREDRNFLEQARRLKCPMDQLHDRFHINAVATGPGPNGSELWVLSHRGILTRVRPDPTSMFIKEAKAGHSLRLIGHNQMAFLDTKREHFVLADRTTGQVIRTVDCGAARVEPKVNPNSGKVAKGGWLRGLDIIDERYAVCGTSPAQLFVVDYRVGKVVDHWQLTKDVRQSTFELTVIK